MQSQNELGQVVNTEVFEDQDEFKARLAELLEKSENLGAVSHAIGRLPSKGSTVDILGLRYEVKSVDGKHGELRLKLVRLTQRAPDVGEGWQLGEKSADPGSERRN